MKVLYLLLAALPLSLAATCRCSSTLCPASQPAACECENRNAIACAKACNVDPVLQDCSQFGEPIICGSRGLAACPDDLPWCVNTPEQLAAGCTIKADCPGFCIAKSSVACAGFAGIACQTEGATCVDDPTDDCDPELGGNDCGGVCVFIKG